MNDLVPHSNVDETLVADLRRLIEEARQRVAMTVNAELTILYWRVGARIHAEVLNSERANYGKQIVLTLSARLTADYGKGFDRSNLFRMLQFASFPG